MRRFTLQLCLLSPLGLLAPVVSGQTTAPAEPVRRSELAAATQDGLETLRDQVLATPFTSDLTVGQFIDRIGGSDALIGRIDANAEQRGGTRWRDEHTCEIRMAIAGADVADALGKVAAERREQLAGLNLRPESLDRDLAELRMQSFSAMGRSTGAGSLERIRPPAGTWRGIADTDRLAAVIAAKVNAVVRVIESLSSLDLGRGKQMADALDVPDLREELRRWLDGRPITNSVFGDDFTVRLTLSAPPHEFWPVVRSALARHDFGPRPDDAGGWDDLRQRMVRGVAAAVGRANAANPLARPNLAINEPPPWAANQISADGSADGGGLSAARVAEERALASLRSQLEALPLGNGKTVGDSAKANPRVDAALADVVNRAQISKTTYRGSRVEARVSLELIRLWRAVEAVE